MYELLGIQAAKLIEKNRYILIGLQQHETFIAQVKGHMWLVLLGYVSGTLLKIQEKQRSHWEVAADSLCD